jgi:hypothetical protein
MIVTTYYSIIARFLTTWLFPYISMGGTAGFEPITNRLKKPNILDESAHQLQLELSVDLARLRYAEIQHMVIKFVKVTSC